MDFDKNLNNCFINLIRFFKTSSVFLKIVSLINSVEEAKLKNFFNQKTTGFA